MGSMIDQNGDGNVRSHIHIVVLATFMRFITVRRNVLSVLVWCYRRVRKGKFAGKIMVMVMRMNFSGGPDAAAEE